MFVLALRTLRICAGDPSLTKLHRLTGLPRTTLHDALALDRATLPSLDLIERFVRACGCDGTELELWRATWRRLKHQLSTLKSQGTGRSSARIHAAPMPAAGMRPPVALPTASTSPGPGWPVQPLDADWRNAESDQAVDRRPGPDAGTADDPPRRDHTRPLPANLIPRQLPRDVATFAGRDQELAHLRTLLGTPDPSEPPQIVVVHGPAGVGKSALAVRVANLLGNRFPHGHLYVNLGAATAGMTPLAPTQAMRRLLRGLWVPPAEIPDDVEESAAMFRSLLAQRRVLILLDDAATEAQLRPLLPGSGGSAVLVTSRTRLAGLEGASHLCLGPLPEDTSITMLNALLGDDGRATAEPAAARHLARLCDHLPLGIQIAAARLVARPTLPIGQLVYRLLDERHRLNELTAADLAVRTSLAATHNGLRDSRDPRDRAAAIALPLLGLVPMVDFGVGLTTALLDTRSPTAEQILERLTNAHLLQETRPGRYRMYGLVRLFARELAATLPVQTAAAARTRVLNLLPGQALIPGVTPMRAFTQAGPVVPYEVGTATVSRPSCA
ncbi:AAA family ATPase [Plantactinospora sp. S1510]|uniref:AAA family ATPase n=1 Tax=Plantactinospora alkalitolerans TaxID=2789879 RepID=A0ABS0GY78_9ACTN|nr:AAA family ATPase [Plantactinospora alkalitolerans]MBF9130913.1 AAA family ATPase [Plantactinospora alkalitolerans]